MSSRQHVAVVGAGLVGASAALGLARLGYSVTLVERHAPTVSAGRFGIDLRNVALTPASQHFLSTLGAWQDERLCAYHSMQVWEQWGSGHLHFSAAEAGVTKLGWVVESSPLAMRLWQACAAHAQIEVVLGEISAVQPEQDKVDIRLADATLQVDLLLAADGAHSTVRNLLQVAVQESPVGQVALATVVQHEQPHQQTARQRFLVDGPLALLPSRCDTVSSVVWSQSPQAAKQRQQLSEVDFCQEISHCLEHTVGRVTEVDQRIVFPLTQQRAATMYPHDRVLLLGDAMRVIHPLAGMGVNLGFEDVAQLLQIARGQSNLAAAGLWRRYARHRETRASAMMATMAGFKTLFGVDLPGAGLVRKVGMTALQGLPALKRQVIREAMGLGTLSAPN